MTKFLIDKAAMPKARLLLAHGAGASADSGVMQQFAMQLAALNIEVYRFNFGYMQRYVDTGKRSLPDKMPDLLQQFSEKIAQCNTGLPLFIGGKSMGGRAASMLSAQQNVRAIFAFGYPFVPPKKLQWRTDHFVNLQCPLFIAQGTRDVFGGKDLLSDKTWPKVELCWLTDGDHDFKPRVKSGLTQLELVEQAAQFCSRKIDEVLLAN